VIYKPILRIIIPILFAGSLVMGCRVEKTSLSTIEPQYPTNTIRTIRPTKIEQNAIEPVTQSVVVSPALVATINKITPTPTKASLQLTYISDRHSGLYGVYAMEVNCLETKEPCLGESKLLFEWDDGVSRINWSPDGKRIAFISGMYGGILFLADWNGENAIQITGTCAAADSPQWSPDGTQVAFIYIPARPGCEMLDYPQIRIYDSNTGEIIQILNEAYSPRRIYWLPDSKFAYIAMNSETDRTDMINIVEADGTLIQQLPNNANDYSHILDATFSPDGQQVAFMASINPTFGRGTDDIYVTNLKGSDTINLTNGSGINLAPAWSPIEDWIAFESNRNGDYEIYLIKTDDQELIEITHNPASETDPAWRILP